MQGTANIEPFYFKDNCDAEVIDILNWIIDGGFMAMMAASLDYWCTMSLIIQWIND